MIDSAMVKSNDGIEKIKESLVKRNHATDMLKEIQSLNEKRSQLIQSSETLSSMRNKISKEIGTIVQNDPAKAEVLKSEVREIGEKLSVEKEELTKVEESYRDILLYLPNILDDDVPIGSNENDNIVVRMEGDIPQYSFSVKPHFEIAENLGLIDFSRGVKLSGSRFYIYNDIISRLERALIDFMLKSHRAQGYSEKSVPFLVSDQAMEGTGQLPKFSEDFYRLEKDNLNLIPTGEVPLTNMFGDEIFAESDLPLYVTAATPCFRKEAGSAGKDTRGLVRVHQFQKVELVKFVLPQNSSAELATLIDHAEVILKKLGLTYRILLLCSGDTGFSSAKTYDIEVWMPGLDRWLEISSCSNFRDFQARRAGIRYKDHKSGKNTLVHTLNGSGVAAGRLIAALLEYYQQSDGTINWNEIETRIGTSVQ